MNLDIYLPEDSDAETMAALDARASQFPWNRQHYLASINKHQCRLFYEGDSLMGLVVFSQVLDEMELLNIVVDPAVQGRGYGRQILKWLTQWGGGASKIHLEVRASNQPAIHLYKSEGFTICGFRKNYYPAESGREDAVLMSFDYSK